VHPSRARPDGSCPRTILGEHDRVSQSDLLLGLGVSIERGAAGDHVEEGDDAGQGELPGDDPIDVADARLGQQRGNRRHRVGEACGFDDHTCERLDLAVAPPVPEIEQRLLDLARRRTAEAAGRCDDGLVAELADQIVVDGDLPELVDQDGCAGEPRIAQHRVDQRRLAGTEEAGDERDGNDGHLILRLRDQKMVPQRCCAEAVDRAHRCNIITSFRLTPQRVLVVPSG
jgi:hypothetical protein